jgi:hypothetical protein
MAFRGAEFAKSFVSSLSLKGYAVLTPNLPDGPPEGRDHKNSERHDSSPLAHYKSMG